MTRTPERGPQCRVLPGKSSRTKLLARSQPAPSPPDLSLSIQMPWYLQVKVLGPKALGTGWSPPCSCCCRGPGQRLLFWGPPSPFLVRCWFLSSPCTAHAARCPATCTRVHTYTHIYTAQMRTDTRAQTHSTDVQSASMHGHTCTHMHSTDARSTRKHAYTYTRQCTHACVHSDTVREPGPPPGCPACQAWPAEGAPEAAVLACPPTAASLGSWGLPPGGPEDLWRKGLETREPHLGAKSRSSSVVTGQLVWSP